MKWNARILSATCAITLLGVVMTGCQSNSNTSQTTAPTSTNNKTETPKQVTLRFSWWGGDARHKGTLDAINLYMKKNPNVKIEAEYGGFDGYREKLVTQLAGASAPDIIQIDAPWVKDLGNADYLVDLNKYKDKLDLKGFDDKFLKDYTVFNNKLLGLPTGINATTFIVNQDMFKQNGIEINQDWDWEKLVTEGKKLHDKNPRQYLLNAEQSVFADMIIRPYVIQKTGQQWIKDDDFTMGFDKEVLTDAFKYTLSLYDNGVLQPAQESFLFQRKAETNPKWLNKEIAGMFNWVSNLPLTKKPMEKETDVTTVPVAKNAKDSGFQVRPSQVMVVNSKSASIEESIKFMNFFFNDKDAALLLTDVRGLPAVEAIRKSLVDANKVDPLAVKATDAALKKAGTPYNALSNNEELIKILIDSVEKVAYKKLTPEQAAADMITRYQDKLKELKSAAKK
ncbi:extracellular solute-binding protein [Paenibacillus sp. N3.4]|nr:extracellular solute-binding protein [Paenibacillus sp. N3.4]